MANETVPTSEQDITELAAINFEPLLTESQVFESEAKYNETWGVKRRITMMSLARSRDQLLSGCEGNEEGAEVLLDMIEHIRDYRTHLEAAVELAEAAMARLLCVASKAINAQDASNPPASA